MEANFVPPVEARTHCVSEKSREAGYYWCGDMLYNPDNVIIAHYARTLCPGDDPAWASERIYGNKRPSRLIATHMVCGDNELEKVKERTELWLMDHPNPPAE